VLSKFKFSKKSPEKKYFYYKKNSVLIEIRYMFPQKKTGQDLEKKTYTTASPYDGFVGRNM